MHIGIINGATFHTNETLVKNITEIYNNLQQGWENGATKLLQIEEFQTINIYENIKQFFL